MTGFYRDGMCRTGEEDVGRHVVCAQVNEAFLEFSRQRGNDLSMPVEGGRFPGLKPGDRWCVCALRWKEAADEGLAPPVVLAATHESALEVVSMAVLMDHALDAE